MGIRAAETCALFLFLAGLFTAPIASATAPEDCYQGGGGAECVTPDLTPYSYAVCDEHGTFTQFEIAWCQAAGGTWSGGVCTGAQPRPRTEDDVVPYAQDFVRNLGGICSGPSTPALPWLAPGQSVSSNLCYSGSPTFTQGWETGNLTDRFAILFGQLDSQGQCQPTDPTSSRSGTAPSVVLRSLNGRPGRRARRVACRSSLRGSSSAVTE
jgi:hypothetical protein